MDGKQFTAFLKQKQTNSTNVLSSKANEYATDKDRFHNFEVSSVLQKLVTQTDKSSAAWNLMSKQLSSVIDIVNSNEPYSCEYLDEKFGDVINYLFLIWGIVSDRCGHKYGMSEQTKACHEED